MQPAKDLARNLEFKTQVDAAAAITTANALKEVHDRLDAVILQRDHQEHRADQFFDQLRELTDQRRQDALHIPCRWRGPLHRQGITTHERTRR